MAEQPQQRPQQLPPPLPTELGPKGYPQSSASKFGPPLPSYVPPPSNQQGYPAMTPPTGPPPSNQSSAKPPMLQPPYTPSSSGYPPSSGQLSPTNPQAPPFQPHSPHNPSPMPYASSSYSHSPSQYSAAPPPVPTPTNQPPPMNYGPSPQATPYGPMSNPSPIQATYTSSVPPPLPPRTHLMPAFSSPMAYQTHVPPPQPPLYLGGEQMTQQTTFVQHVSPAPPVTHTTTTVVTYGDGTVFAVPSRWRIKREWGWPDMRIKDEWDNDVFYANAKGYHFNRTVNFIDLRTGIEIATLKSKLNIGIMSKFKIYLGGVKYATISQKFSLLSPKFVVYSLDGVVSINGNWMASNFSFHRGAHRIASVERERLSYYVTIQPGEDVIFILACCIIVSQCLAMY